MTKLGTHEVLYTGEAAQLVAICQSNGRCPTNEWLDGLTEPQWAAIWSRIEMFADRGWLKNPDAFRYLATADVDKGLPSVAEIKHVGKNLRLYVADFSSGDTTVFVTHGSTKPKKKGVAREVARARTIYKER